MFTNEELEMISTFFNIQDNKDNVLLHMDSKNTKNQWILIDFSEQFTDRYGIYHKGAGAKIYKSFNQVNALGNVLNLISKYESNKN